MKKRSRARRPPRWPNKTDRAIFFLGLHENSNRSLGLGGMGATALTRVYLFGIQGLLCFNCMLAGTDTLSSAW